MRDFDKVAAAHAAISTRAEWLKLEQQRAAPETVHDLTPNNELSAEIKSQDAERNEERLAFLRGQLDRSQERLEHDHARARLEGHARVDFDRGR